MTLSSASLCSMSSSCSVIISTDQPYYQEIATIALHLASVSDEVVSFSGSFRSCRIPMYSLQTSIDPTNKATVTLKFSGIDGSCADSDTALKSMVEGTVAKTEAKPWIVTELEKVRGLTKTIEGMGDAVAEVVWLTIISRSDVPECIVYEAASSSQSDVESDEAAN